MSKLTLMIGSCWLIAVNTGITWVRCSCLIHLITMFKHILACSPRVTTLKMHILTNPWHASIWASTHSTETGIPERNSWKSSQLKSFPRCNMFPTLGSYKITTVSLNMSKLLYLFPLQLSNICHARNTSFTNSLTQLECLWCLICLMV